MLCVFYFFNYSTGTSVTKWDTNFEDVPTDCCQLSDILSICNPIQNLTLWFYALCTFCSNSTIGILIYCLASFQMMIAWNAFFGKQFRRRQCSTRNSVNIFGSFNASDQFLTRQPLNSRWVQHLFELAQSFFIFFFLLACSLFVHVKLCAIWNHFRVRMCSNKSGIFHIVW